MDSLTIYAAGLFDGEGCVGIHRTTPQSKSTTSPLLRYRLVVVIQMVNREAIDALNQRWTASIGSVKSRQPNHRDCYQWNLQALKAKQFLEDVLPYLIVKKPHAQLGIQFQEHLIETGKLRYTGQGFQRYPLDEITRIRDDFYNQMKILNMRGTSHLQNQS